MLDGELVYDDILFLAGDVMTLPLCSVIISSFNRPRLIRDAIDSVLAQTWPQDRLQILIADDWSNRETSRVIGDYIETTPNVSMVRPASVPTDQERQYGSRCAIGINAAMPLVRGSFVCYLPDDDALSSNSIEDRARFLMAHPQANIVYGRLMSCKPFDGKPVEGLHSESTARCVHDTNSFWSAEPIASGANKLDHSMFMLRCDMSNVVGIPRWPPKPTSEYDCDDAGFLNACAKAGVGPCYSVDSLVTMKRQHQFAHRSNPAVRE